MLAVYGQAMVKIPTKQRRCFIRIDENGLYIWCCWDKKLLRFISLELALIEHVRNYWCDEIANLLDYIVAENPEILATATILAL